MDVLEQESQVICQSTHGLHALGIQSRFALGTAIDDIPILGSDDRHVHNLERHRHRLQSRCGTTTTADSYGCSGFVAEQMARRIHQTLHQGHRCAIGLAIIHGGTDNEGIGREHAFTNAVAEIVVEDAMSQILGAALGASNTRTHRLRAQLYDFGLYTILLQLLSNLAKCDKRVALFARAGIHK